MKTPRGLDPAGYVQNGGVLSVAIWNTNDYGRFSFVGSAPLTGRLDVAVQGGFRPALGKTFNVLNYPSYTGMIEGFNGIDLDNGLRLDPRIQPAGLSFVTSDYSTNVLERVYISALPQFVFLWWPIALSGWGLEGATNITIPVWTPVSATNNNVVLPGGGSNTFFRITTQL